MFRPLLAVIAAIVLCALPPGARAGISIVAAENFYGDVARQVGGADVAVTSILGNPDQDPHLFEASPSVARAVAGAGIVISNGIGYDSWMDGLLAASAAPGRRVIVVSDLVGGRAGDDPHIWYNPASMAALARAVADACAAADPGHASGYTRRLQTFLASMDAIERRIAALHRRYAGAQVTATEPVFHALFAALGVVSRNTAFQRAVMNETEVSATELAAFESDLRSRRVRLLLVNRQATNALADRMKVIAGEAGVPVLDVSEAEPLGTTYQAWISGELDALEHAMECGPCRAGAE